MSWNYVTLDKLGNVSRENQNTVLVMIKHYSEGNIHLYKLQT